MVTDNEKLYYNRTLGHIHRVQKNIFKIVTNGSINLSRESRRKLAYQAMIHDRSKFGTSQFDGYIELTKYYHEKRNGNPDYQYPNEKIKKMVDLAVTNHYHVENHHPERLENSEMFDALEIIEIICDLQAMADEFNEGSCIKYFTDVWCKKHSPSEAFVFYAKSIIDLLNDNLK